MIVHVDMDAFYAAIEVRERPELAGLPVIVGADPRGRGVVSTCSYEARRFGVRSAMPIGEAARRCPQGVFLPVRMALYVDVSRRVMAIFSKYSPLVEPLSIDEAFLDVIGCEGLFGPPEEIARRIKQEIRSTLSLACSVGVAPNKFLAKLATELGKPDGLTVIAPDEVRTVLDPLPVDRVFGIGKRSAEALIRSGIRTIGELARASPPRVELCLGRSAAAHVQRLARGEDDRDVEPFRLPKQMGSERTFAFDLDDPTELHRQLLDLAGEVGAALRDHGYTTRSVRLKVRTHNFVTTTRTRTFSRPTDSDRVLHRAARELFDRARITTPVRLLGVTASDLVHESGDEQPTLFAVPDEEAKSAGVDRVKDRVRRKFGQTALRPATLLATNGGPLRRK